MTGASKATRTKAAGRDRQQGATRRQASLSRALHALAELAEQFRAGLDEALQNARARQLGAARHVEQVCRYLLHRHKAAQRTQWQTPPQGVVIGADLGVALRFIDAGELRERLEAWSGLIAALAAYEGKAFGRKPLEGQRKVGTTAAPPSPWAAAARLGPSLYRNFKSSEL